jgi:biopolymer transport protein ExbD
VDVVLVLLVIFMVTAPMMMSGVKVQLPRAVSQPLDLKETLLVTVTDRGQFAIGDTPMSFDRFAAAFQTRIGLQRPKSVAIQGDRSAKLDWILQVVSLVKNSGIQEVGIVTTPTRGSQ